MTSTQPGTPGFLLPLARLLIAQIFFVSALLKLSAFAGTVGFMASKGVPLPDVLLVLTIAIELVGSLAILLGWKTRWAALLLVLWMVPVTLVFHRFWGVDAAQVMPQATHFMKNLCIMGGLLALYVHGGGAMSLDAKAGR
ncbi:MAG: DoxX family protein [Burkholderiaceae bacterium]|nr:DoxX family protein [Burkholderiaceae bacterium]